MDNEICMCTNITLLKDGRVNISCKLGLWSVQADYDRAIKEAANYFMQYKSDGEYARILGNDDI